MTAQHVEVALELVTAGAFFIVSRLVTPTKNRPYKRLVPTVLAIGLIVGAGLRILFGN